MASTIPPYHTEVLKDPNGVMSPIVMTVAQLHEEMTACTLQLTSITEEVTAVKQQTLRPTHPTSAATAVQTADLADSPLLPPVVKTQLHLQSTMQPGSLPDPVSSPGDSLDLRGRFISQSPGKLHFPCFGRMEDCIEPLMYLEQCHEYLALNPPTDEELLATLRNVLYGTARDWWDVTRLETCTWKEFESKFLSAFVLEDYTDELEERVRMQVQGKGVWWVDSATDTQPQETLV